MKQCGKTGRVLLYCHDGPIYQDQQGVYYDYSLSRQFLKQYFALAEQVRLLVRVRPLLAEDGGQYMNPLDMPGLSVVKAYDLKSARGLMHLRAAEDLVRRQIEEADFVVCRFSGPTADLAAMEARRRGIPYLAECVNCAWDINWYHSIIGKCAAPFSYFASRRGIRRASHVLYVSGRFLQKRYPTSGKSLGWPDAVLENIRKEVPEKYTLSAGERKRIVLGTAGGLDPAYKGQAFVIRALAYLKEKGDTRYLYRLAGPGKGEGLLRLAERLGVADQVEICGCLSGERMRDWYESLDLYLQPSLTEGMPRALLEAMAAGIAAAGSRCGGTREILHPDAQFPPGKKGIRPLCHFLQQLNNDTLIQLSAYGLRIAQKYRAEHSADVRIAFYRDYGTLCLQNFPEMQTLYGEEGSYDDQNSSYCTDAGSGRDRAVSDSSLPVYRPGAISD